MHIGIAGHIATADIAPLLDEPSVGLPHGVAGAPLLSVLIEALLHRGHRVSAYTLSTDLPLRRHGNVTARGAGLTVHYVPSRPRAWPFNGWRPGRIVDLYAFERAGLCRAMRSDPPDVVHAHWAYFYAWAALRSGLPHVVTCHDAPALIARQFSQMGWRWGAYRWLLAGMARHVLAHAEQVTAVSPHMAQMIAGWCRVPVAVVPNPVSPLAFAQCREAAPEHGRVVMVCNGWNALKNGDTALRAFAALGAARPGVELVACGDSFGQGQEAERWWRAQGLRGRVRFVGPLPHARLLSTMASADLLLHPSREESFGLVPAEAMALGLPVVAGEHSGAVPWVLGTSACLVDIGDAGAMARAMQDILANSTAWRQRAEHGRRNIEHRFKADSVAAAYERSYLNALGPTALHAGMAAAR